MSGLDIVVVEVMGDQYTPYGMLSHILGIYMLKIWKSKLCILFYYMMYSSAFFLYNWAMSGNL